MGKLNELTEQIFLNCVFKYNDFKSLSLLEISQKVYSEIKNITVDTDYIEQVKQGKREDWRNTIFKEIKITEIKEKVPEKYQRIFDNTKTDLMSVKKHAVAIKKALKEYIVNNWDSEKPKIMFHSGGYDTRIISHILVELREEKGEKWIGNIHFRCHQPEEKEFLEIMQLQGWKPEQYSVWEHAPEDHYLIGNPKDIVNGFCPLSHQMNFWSDIIPKDKEKDYILIGGSNGGEFFNYFAKDVKPYKEFNYCKNMAINRWLNYFEEEGEWMSENISRFGGVILPYVSYEFLKAASVVPDSMIKMETEYCENIRYEILKTFKLDALQVIYGDHNYTWNLSEKTLEDIYNFYNNSKFYNDFKVDILASNIDEYINCFDSRLAAFSMLYEQINIRKIALITGMWRRPELTNKIFSYYNNLKKELSPGIELINIVAGSEGNISRNIAEKNNWVYVECKNTPLNLKFNLALQKAKEFNPDYVVVAGSDNIISKGIFTNVYAKTNAEILGFLDAYIYSEELQQLLLWNGYTCEREGECVGGGRTYSRSVLEKLNWEIWDKSKPINSSLDLQAYKRCCKAKIKFQTLRLRDINEFIVDIKSKENITNFAIFVGISDEITLNKDNANVINTIKSVLSDVSAKEIKTKTEPVKDYNIGIVWRIISMHGAEKAVKSIEIQTDKNINIVFTTHKKDVANYLLSKGHKVVYDDLQDQKQLRPKIINGAVRQAMPINELFNSGLKELKGCNKIWIIDTDMMLFDSETVLNVKQYLDNDNIMFCVNANGKIIKNSLYGIIFNSGIEIEFLPYVGGGETAFNKIKDSGFKENSLVIAKC